MSTTTTRAKKPAIGNIWTDPNIPDRAGEVSKGLPVFKPTPAQQDALDRMEAGLLWSQPFFASVLLDMLEVVPVAHPAVPYMATDGRKIWVNVPAVEKWTIRQLVFGLCHEVMHCIQDHCRLSYKFRQNEEVVLADGRRLPYEHEQMNIAMDYVINAMLVESSVGEKPPIGIYVDPGNYPADMAVTDAYAKLYDPQKNKGGSGQPGDGHGSFDTHFDPCTGDEPGQEVDSKESRNEAAWATAVQSAIESAQAQGKLPATIARAMSAIIKPPVDWRDHILGFLARRIGGERYDWRRPDRRLIVRAQTIVAPGRSGAGVGTVVVGVDTSGSIGEKTLEMFLGAIAGMLEDLKPERILVVWCDARVHRVDEVADGGDIEYLRCAGAPGGGGTAFEPVFDKVAEMGIVPDALVYLTDLYGSFPSEAPGYPVLWAKISDATPPWGDEVKLVQQEA